jgi:hydroxymethylbilane synthase
MIARLTLRLGTRPSLLAMAQSRLVARELEHLHPHVQVELITVHTRGDHDRQTPLTEINDPGFFASELDAALLAGKVDFCVHSWKDLERKRPPEISLAAVPKRENPRDVILFGADVDDKIERGATLTIGSSSARRQINIGDFLPRALPCSRQPASIKFHPLRGPVDARLARIGPQAEADRLDGVVLALAGLARLWADPAGRAAIAPLLTEARWMILPLETCPTAAGQGALAIECRHADSGCLDLLKSLHHSPTATLLAHESAALRRHAGSSTHLAGATSISHPELGHVSFVRGRTSSDGTETIAAIESASRCDPGSFTKPYKAWSGGDWKQATQRTAISTKLPESGALFAAHWHALDGRALNSAIRCWTSGPTSWQKLAKQGIWVEGCADNLGFAACVTTLQTPVMQLPELAEWTALTHIDAVAGWRSSGIVRVLSSYALTATTATYANEQMNEYTHFYWSSARQYEHLKRWLPADAHHACGAGKTPAALRSAGLDDVQAFASRREWQQWLS